MSSTSKKKARMNAKERVRYWEKRHKTEERHLKLLQSRMETLQRQIEKQTAVKTWAMNQMDAAHEADLADKMNPESENYDPEAEQ
jgi:hypothetical protein